MRILFVFFIIVMLQICGCAFHPPEKIPLDVHTSLLTDEGSKTLNSRANNLKLSQEVRARAVFMLFANHVNLGSSSSKLKPIFDGASWLQQSLVREVDILGGWVPVEMNSNDTVFAIMLFPEDTEKQWSPWAIFIRLSGRHVDLSAFLKGNLSSEDINIVEFALCFPPSPNIQSRMGRIERFSKDGVDVYQF